MMTLKWIDLHCPVCESVFESMAASSNDEDGQDYYIDPGAPASIAIAVLPFLVHVCPRCGYVGSVSDFGDDVEITDDLRTRRRVSFLSGPTGASPAQPLFDKISSFPCLLH